MGKWWIVSPLRAKPPSAAHGGEGHPHTTPHHMHTRRLPAAQPQPTRMPQKNTCARPGCTRAVARNTTDTYQGLCFQHAKAAGYAHNYIPWEQAHPHLERLLNGGWTINEIAFHSGVSNSTLAGIQKHRRERFKYASVQALKQLPDNSPTRRPAWPLRRRINALRAIGI